MSTVPTPRTPASHPIFPKGRVGGIKSRTTCIEVGCVAGLLHESEQTCLSSSSLSWHSNCFTALPTAVSPTAFFQKPIIQSDVSERADACSSSLFYLSVANEESVTKIHPRRTVLMHVPRVTTEYPAQPKPVTSGSSSPPTRVSLRHSFASQPKEPNQTTKTKRPNRDQPNSKFPTGTCS